ncbi:MAG: DUF4091 domain-containing protein, partial [bacterium]|nr:DUF4091 domain-containing protein [bacterium]
MSRNRRASFITLTVLTLAVASSGFAAAQAIGVANPSFETGADGPEGWTLSGGDGAWQDKDAADGTRAIAVSGDGKTTNHWRSDTIPFEPSTAYWVRFRARSENASGGTPVTGAVFANRDLWGIPDTWKTYDSVFMTPSKLTADNAWLRFGQWEVNGTILFDNIELFMAQPLYAEVADLELGEGESISGNAYAFNAPFATKKTNHSRPLLRHNCTFNTLRWVFGANSEVIYRHTIGNRTQQHAEVQVGITYYTSGKLSVDASTDGETWTELGAIESQASSSFPIPDDLLPAKTVYIRMRAAAKKRVNSAESDGGSFQVTTYGYTATVDGTAAEGRGKTRYVGVASQDPRVRARVVSLGDAMPGAESMMTVEVESVTGEPVKVLPQMTITGNGGAFTAQAKPRDLKPGRATLDVPYTLPKAGSYKVELSLGADATFTAYAALDAPVLYESAYGERLETKGDVGLWWASSGWKVSQSRPLPKAKGKAVVIRAARNEAEAAQLVVRPAKPLTGLRAECGPLKGAKGAVLPADCVEILRVGYVPVTTPTDETSVCAPWPDPLPPFTGPIDVEAETNQPLWVLAKAPRHAAPGLYKGTIRLTADGYEAKVPLEVEVYGFELPDRMTCVSAFGFSPPLVSQYHKVTDPDQQRQVVDKYLQSFRDHRISPYDPTPFDEPAVEWTGLGLWNGGTRDPSEKHSGETSLMLRDDSDSANISADYMRHVRIPDGGLRLQFWYKTHAPGHEAMVTLTHHHAGGAWLSGKNNDTVITGNGEWQLFDKTITAFPADAGKVHLILRAARWSEPGSTTGATWFDDLSLTAASGAELVEDGGFEPVNGAPEPVFDWTNWDAAMAKAMDEYQFNCYRMPIPGMGGGTFHARTPPSLLGFAEDTPQYKAAFSAYCAKLEDHLQEKGWLDEAYVYWFDEPDPKDYEFVMNGFQKLKDHAPGIGRMLTEQIEPELVGGPNIWCPLTPSYDKDQAAERRKDGDEFWWYVCTGPKAPYATLFIDHPGTEMRVWLWQTWKRRIDGILIWQSNYWTSNAAYPDGLQNPYEDPMSWVSGYSTPGGKRKPWGNGDGRFIYP